MRMSVMSGHRTRAVFEHYNVVDTQDLRAAVRALESLGHVSDTPRCFGPRGAVGLPRTTLRALIPGSRGPTCARVLAPKMAAYGFIEQTLGRSHRGTPHLDGAW